MAPGTTLFGSYFSSRICRRMLLLLIDLTQIQQVMQLEPESVLHPQEVRKVEDDAEYDLADPPDASQLK